MSHINVFCIDNNFLTASWRWLPTRINSLVRALLSVIDTLANCSWRLRAMHLRSREANVGLMIVLPAALSSAHAADSVVIGSQKQPLSATGNPMKRSFLMSLFLLALLISGFAHAFCVPPKVAIDCCGYTFRDGNPAKDIRYNGPLTVYGNETDARTFAAAQTPRMPFYFPYEGETAQLMNGWVYESGDSHASSDFQKSTVVTDPTFKVLAVGDGIVVSKVWDNWHGNVVTIEHTASDGSRYRTLYFHLRNGYAGDLASARAIMPPNPSKVDQWTKYSRYANLKDPKAIHWGTEAQKILVNVGDRVTAGQQIAFSGNTGVGGASAGLKDDGTPMDATRANNHLHFMLAVPNPKTSGEWIFIDPFGFYEKAGSGCADAMKDNPYKRFFAPFPVAFHGVNSDLYFKYFSYYADMGLGPQTLSFYQQGNAVKVAGVYDAAVKSPWLARGLMSTNDFAGYVKKDGDGGFRPREISVMIDSAGQPRFSAIWKKRASELYEVWINMTDAELDQKWKSLVAGQGFRIEDFSAYFVAGQHRTTAIFVKDGMAFAFHHGLTEQQYSAKFNELHSQGYANTSFNAVLPSGDRYAGVWTKPGGTSAMYFNMTADGYQSRFSQLSGQGFKLHKIQGYAGGGRFGAIWKK